MRITDDELASAVQKAHSVSETIRILGRNRMGSSHTHISNRIRLLGLDTSHFGRMHAPKQLSTRRLTAEEILVQSKSRRAGSVLTRALIESGVPHECANCGLGPEWREERLVLHVDHINGDPTDHRIGNLRFLCPNCHSQCWETNAPHRHKAKNVAIRCRDCGVEIRKGSTWCRECAKSHIPHPEKANWPTDAELLRMVAESNRNRVAKSLGVSETAVRKRLARIR